MGVDNLLKMLAGHWGNNEVIDLHASRVSSTGWGRGEASLPNSLAFLPKRLMHHYIIGWILCTITDLTILVSEPQAPKSHKVLHAVQFLNTSPKHFLR